MIEMMNNSFYENKIKFRLVKRGSYTQKIWTVKKMIFSGKYIAKLFSLKRFLVSEYVLKLIRSCEGSKESESGICFT